ncbi:MAG: YvrJ family protein [Clostridiales bacterium]|nr:YvrJ family protein [Clostridiales bacterium]
MEDFLIAIANYGFPIIIAVYLLVRMEQKLEKLETAINELNHNIKKLCEK